MSVLATIGSLLLCLTVLCLAETNAQEPAFFQWSELPPISDATGVAGAFAGLSGDVLIVAGGANFPQGMPWNGGEKHFYDEIYLLLDKTEWVKSDQRLPHRLAYGVSVSYKGAMVCIGGSDGKSHYDEVFSLSYAEGEIKLVQLPSLPEPIAECGAALVGSTVYVVGGIGEPLATSASQQVWALNLALSAEEQRWQAVGPLPGAGRMQPTCGAFNANLYVFGGTQITPATDGTNRTLHYLSDAYCLSSGTDDTAPAWRRLADLLRPNTASPSPALSLASGQLVVLGGVSKPLVGVEPKDHPGFDRAGLLYNIDGDQWTVVADVWPSGAPRVCAPTVRWNDGWAIVSGEIAPGRRSPDVLFVRPQSASFGLLNWTVLVAYLVSMVAIGIHFARRERTTNDFTKAGGRIPWWAAGLSIFGTQLSAITFMTVPALTYKEDWRRIVGPISILIVAFIVIRCYLPFYRRLNVTTAYEYLEKRFHLVVRLLASAAFMLLQIGRMGVVLYLPALVLATVTDVNMLMCIAIMGGVTTLYTVIGGIEAVIWIDVVQVSILMGGAIMSLGIVIAQQGGVSSFIVAGMADGKFKPYLWDADWSQPNLWVLSIGFLFLSLIPYSSDQSVVQRYLTTKDERAAARGIWLNGLLAIPTALLFSLLGTALYVFYQTRPELPTPEKIDQIVPWFIVYQLPVGLAGIAVAGIFAAAMSSDGGMNAIATAFVTDFYRRLKANVPDVQALKVAKLATLLAGFTGTVAAMLIASYPIQSLFDFFNEILGILGGSLCGVFVLGIFTRRANTAGALVGVIAGTAAPLCLRTFTSASGYLNGAASVLSCIVAGYLASVLLPSRRGSLASLTLFDRPGSETDGG